MSSLHLRSFDRRFAEKALVDFFSEAVFYRTMDWMLIGYCLTAGISIALSQIAFIAIGVLWLGRTVYLHSTDSVFETELAPQQEDPDRLSYTTWFAVPLATWLLVAVLASLVGINTGKAFIAVAKSLTFILFPFALACTFRVENAANFQQMIVRSSKYLFLLVCGQCLAAIHSIASAAIGFEIHPRPPGAVTESGQLALVIPVLAALYWLAAKHLLPQDGPNHKTSCHPSYLSRLALLFFFLSLIVCAWPQVLNGVLDILPTTTIQLFAAAVSLLCLLIARVEFSQNSELPKASRRELILSFAGALLLAVFIINLKRGPWLGVFVALTVLGFFISRKLMLATVSATILGLLVLEPARDRLLAFVNDFLIFGGRRSMWTLGVELVERFPLGLGLNNASFMRVMDPSLPSLHRHMHNNLLNVAVESGLLGLAVFIWWIFVTIGIGFILWKKTEPLRKNELVQSARVLMMGISCALISWQVAGLVEYNFGDGEVRMIAFFLMGLLLALAESIEAAQISSIPQNGISR